MLGAAASAPAPPARTVAFFDAYPRARGGGQAALRQMAAGLRERGWQVRVLLPTDGQLRRELDADGVRVDVVAAPPALTVYGGATVGLARVAAGLSLPRYWWRLARLLRGHVDALHAQDLRGLLLAGPAARLARIPVVWHVHADSGAPLLNRLAGRLATRVVLSSPSLAIPGVPVHPDRDVVPNGVPVPPSVPVRTPAVPPRLVTLSRLHPVKQVEVLLDATAQLRAAGIDVRVDVLGEEQPGHEEYAAMLRRRAEELRVDDVVTFHGHVDHPEPMLDAAAVYVHTSSHEMQPLAILEAMSRAVPVVASAVGGVPEIVRDGDTGRLVPDADPTAVAAAVRELLADPAAAAAMGRRAHDHVRAHFDAAAVADRVDRLYRDLLGSPA
ncbi:MAG TPA: glycosyltransferase family 4 protein [Mycobacteriales bacterium]|nr:glycosyltransferase family 4 protein [Mycobacteriales bacterium]